MAIPVFPTLPGIAYPVKRSPVWSTAKADALSGKRTRTALRTYPTYNYEVSFKFLRTNVGTEWQTIMGFVNGLNGPATLFAFTDPDDSVATNQQFGSGDGATTNFQLVRTLGGFAEPVVLLNGNPTIQVAGVTKTLGVDYAISATANIVFATPPANGAALTWSGNYYWPCRLDDDETGLANTMSTFYELKTLKFSTEKLDIIVAVAAPNVIGVSPPTGDIAGGTAVTISGGFFTGATSVKFNGVAATSVVVVNGGTITCNTPANTAGVVNVAVTTPQGTGTGTGIYTYTAWFTAYAIGGTNPLMFADPTTEGGSHHYLFNGTAYGSFAAWLTAVSGTFSRASAKYVTNSSGNLVQISSGVVPFDYSPTSIGTLNGLLLEGASTNYDSQSETFSGWGVQDTAVTANSATSPRGDNTATLLVPDTSNAQHLIYDTISVPSPLNSNSAVGTQSVFLKAAGYNFGGISVLNYTVALWAQAIVDLTTGAVTTAGTGLVSATARQYPNGWWRLSLTFNQGWTAMRIFASNTGTAVAGAATSFAGNGTSGIYAWGAQLEALPFASSYIPTTSSSASRAADVLTVPWTATTATFRIKSINTPFVSNAALIGTNNADEPISMASATQVGTYNASATLAQTSIVSWPSLNITGVSGGNTGRYLSANGTAATSDANKLFGSAPTNLAIAAGSLGSVSGNLQQFGAWTVAATAGQLATMTGVA
jgi:uncharacterized protein (TIGR02217 family)